MGMLARVAMHCERLTAKSDGMLVLDGMGTLPTELMPLIGQGSQGMTTAAKSLACLARSTNREQGKKSKGFVVSDYRKFKGRWGR